MHLNQGLSVGGSRVEEGTEMRGVAALIFIAIHPLKQWQWIKVAVWFHSSNLGYHHFFQAVPQSNQGGEIHINALSWFMTNHVQNAQCFPAVRGLCLIIFSITVQHYLQLICRELLGFFLNIMMCLLKGRSDPDRQKQSLVPFWAGKRPLWNSWLHLNPWIQNKPCLIGHT